MIGIIFALRQEFGQQMRGPWLVPKGTGHFPTGGYGLRVIFSLQVGHVWARLISLLTENASGD